MHLVRECDKRTGSVGKGKFELNAVWSKSSEPKFGKVSPGWWERQDLTDVFPKSKRPTFHGSYTVLEDAGDPNTSFLLSAPAVGAPVAKKTATMTSECRANHPTLPQKNNKNGHPCPSAARSEPTQQYQTKIF